MSFEIEVQGGSSVRLPTAGKYCDRDIVVTATGGDTEGAYEEGYEAGQQAEYDRFWDAFQDNGNRTDYSYAFAMSGWNATTLKPKYDLVCSESCANMFYECGASCSLPNILETQGIQLDISTATSINSMFQYSSFTEISIDLSNWGESKKNTYLCADCDNLEKVFLKMAADTFINSNWFSNDDKITEITIDGVIGKNNFNVTYCPNLTHDSLMSIINALKDYSSEDAPSTSMKVSFGSTNLAKLTDAEKAIATEKGWTLV